MKKINKLNNIAVKLIAGFMVVIILIILLGIISYNGSFSAMSKSYRQSMSSTVTTTASRAWYVPNQCRSAKNCRQQ